MTLLTTFAFGKEYILINDSLVIFSIMALLLALIIQNLSPVLKEFFQSTRSNIENDLTVIVRDILKISLANKEKLSDVIRLNANRDLLV